jgi:hypothetical protein
VTSVTHLVDGSRAMHGSSRALGRYEGGAIGQRAGVGTGASGGCARLLVCVEPACGEQRERGQIG